jgi:hypothetical protein
MKEKFHCDEKAMRIFAVMDVIKGMQCYTVSLVVFAI